MYIRVTKLIVWDGIFFEWCTVCCSCVYIDSTEGWEDGNYAQTWAATSCTPHVRRERCLPVATGQALANPYAMKFSLIPRPLLWSRFVGEAWIQGYYSVWSLAIDTVLQYCSIYAHTQAPPMKRLCGRGLGMISIILCIRSIWAK